MRKTDVACCGRGWKLHAAALTLLCLVLFVQLTACRSAATGQEWEPAPVPAVVQGPVRAVLLGVDVSGPSIASATRAAAGYAVSRADESAYLVVATLGPDARVVADRFLLGGYDRRMLLDALRDLPVDSRPRQPGTLRKLVERVKDSIASRFGDRAFVLDVQVFSDGAADELDAEGKSAFDFALGRRASRTPLGEGVFLYRASAEFGPAVKAGKGASERPTTDVEAARLRPGVTPGSDPVTSPAAVADPAGASRSRTDETSSKRGTIPSGSSTKPEPGPAQAKTAPALAQLRDEEAQLRMSVERLSVEVTEAMSRVVAVRAELDLLERRRDQIEAILEKRTAEATALQERLDTLKASVATAAGEASAIVRRRDDLSRQRDDLRERVERERVELDTLLRQVEDGKGRLASIRREEGETDSRLEALRAQVADAEGIIADLRAKEHALRDRTDAPVSDAADREAAPVTLTSLSEGPAIPEPPASTAGAPPNSPMTRAGVILAISGVALLGAGVLAWKIGRRPYRIDLRSISADGGSESVELEVEPGEAVVLDRRPHVVSAGTGEGVEGSPVIRAGRFRRMRLDAGGEGGREVRFNGEPVDGSLPRLRPGDRIDVPSATGPGVHTFIVNGVSTVPETVWFDEPAGSLQ